MKFTTIEQIKAHLWVGNAMFDAEAFQAVDIFVHDLSNSESDRAEALRDMGDREMGLDREEHKPDSQILYEYDEEL